MIKSDELDKVEKLYKAGIRRIIPVVRGDTALEEECKKIGMEYQAIIFDSKFNDAFKTFDEVKSSAKEYARDIFPIKNYLRRAENLYHNLTDSDKLKMGWTKDFEKTFN